MVHPVVPDHGLYFLLHGQDIVLFLPRLKLKLTDQSANYTEWGVFHSLALPKLHSDSDGAAVCFCEASPQLGGSI